MAIGRQLEKDVLYVNRFTTGLVNQRSPLFAPISSMGLQMLSHMDTLWDGLNADISHKNTLVRRAGFARYCSSALGASEIPNTFYSFKNTTGVVKALVDTNTRVAWFDTTSTNTIFSKTSPNQTSFQKVGSTVYMCNGNDADMKKWNGTTTTKWGIDAPTTAPTLSFTGGSLSPKTGYKYVYVFKNSSTGHISTASPVSADTLPMTNKNVMISGASSTDPQVDKIEIYRNYDGGSMYYYLATVNNTVGWSYTDSTKDDNLNDMIVAPLSNLNDPPPSGSKLVCFYLGRMWVAKGNELYFGAGPEITNGVPEECFPPANVFKLPGEITAMAPTSSGLAVWTHTDSFVVLGADVPSFYCKMWQANFGVASQNCVVQDGDLLFVFTSKGQLFAFAGELQEVGFPIQGTLGSLNPNNVYLALHRSGADEGLFITNGTSDVYRYSVSMQCWSTKIQPVGGVKCLQSIEVVAGSYRLMMGRATGSGYILARDPNVYTDDGATYQAWATIGSLVLAPPRQTVLVNSLLIEAIPNGTYPTLSVLLNEIDGTFTALPNPVPDPPQLAASTSVWMKRHDLKAAQKPLPQHVRHMQIKVAWPSEAAANELLSIGIA